MQIFFKNGMTMCSAITGGLIQPRVETQKVQRKHNRHFILYKILKYLHDKMCCEVQ